MKLPKLTLFSAILIATAATAQVSVMSVPDRDPATPNLDTIKKLVGDWVELDEAGVPTDNVVSSYRVTAGGTAVLDVEFGGTDHEMLTVFHQDGDDLVLTHYCMLGNQPRARAVKTSAKSALRFDCDGIPGNAASHDEKHIHGWSIELADDGVLHYHAALVENGKVAEEPTFALTRVERSAAR